MDGWGNLSATNLKFSIENSKNITLDKLIFSLGIRHIGQENAKLLSDNIKTYENLSKIDGSYNFENFMSIDGIGETQIKSLRKFFSNETNIKIISRLEKFLSIKKIEKKQNKKLMNKTFLITGKLSGLSRAEAKSIIENKSGKILSSVNSKLNYLIIGENPTNKKINKAKELNIKIISQNEFLKLVG